MENSNADMLLGRILSSYIPSERYDLYWAMYLEMVWAWAKDGMILGTALYQGIGFFAIITDGRIAARCTTHQIKPPMVNKHTQ